MTTKRGLKNVMRVRTKLSAKTIFIVAASLVILITSGLIVFLNLSNPHKAIAAASGDYRTKASGNWNSTGTWEKYNGTSWVAATSTPTSSNGVITILNGHTVTITSGVTVDQVIINSGGQVILNSGVTLTINASSAIDFDVYGIFKSAGTVTLSGGPVITFESGGKYQHNFTTTAGTIPTATWASGSTCEIIGYTSNSSSPNGLGQSFYNFTWNCISQNSASLISLAGNLTTVNGNLTITSTGSGDVELANSVSPTVSVTGAFSQSGGTLILNNSSGTTILNLAGNISITGGNFQKGGGTGNVNFNGTSTQTFNKSGGTISGAINFTILSGAIVDFGTSILDGSSGTFTTNASSILSTANLSGFSSSGATGSIQVTGTRTFSTSGDYIYHGAAAQITGNGLPSSVRNLTFNNPTNVTLTNTLTVSNLLTLSSGIVLTNSNELIVSNTSTSSITGYSSTSYIAGNLRRSVSATGAYDFPLGTSTNYELLNVNLSSTTGFSNILGSFTNANPINPIYPLSGITVSGTPITDILDYGYWTMTPNTSITGGTYTITLNETGQTNAGSLAAGHAVLVRSNTSSSWQSLGTHANSTQTITGSTVTAARSALNNFYQYGIGRSTSGSLPIELIYFKAELNEGITNLSWATASELNNDYFTVERSSDGMHFEELLRKNGAGNSTNTLYYTDVDQNPMKGYSYYRLKQTDYDGHFTYSDIKTIKNKSGMEESILKIISVNPNPFTEKFTISFMLTIQTPVNIQLLNSSGQIVFKDIINSIDGLNQYNFVDKTGLPDGIYFINLIYNDKKVSQKIIKS